MAVVQILFLKFEKQVNFLSFTVLSLQLFAIFWIVFLRVPDYGLFLYRHALRKPSYDSQSQIIVRIGTIYISRNAKSIRLENS